MSSPMQPGGFANLLDPALKHSFSETLEARQKLAKRTEIFGMGQSVRQNEVTQALGNMNSNMSNLAIHGQTQYKGHEKGYATTWKFQEFSDGVMYERSFIDDLLDGSAPIPRDLKQQPKLMATAVETFYEKAAASVFNNAFTDSGTVANMRFNIAGPDAVGLCSTAHPYSPTNSTTQSNEGTLALSAANLETTCVAMENLTDDQGDVCGVNPDTLLVPTALRATGRQILNSPQMPGTANNDINPTNIQKMIVWPYLTDQNAWFVLDSERAKEHLLWMERVAAEWSSRFDTDKQKYVYGVYTRFTRQWDDYKFVYGQNPG